MDELLHRINGRIRTTTKLEQLSRVAVSKGLELLHPTPLTVTNGWLSGFFCGDGHFAINSSNYQPSIQLHKRMKISCVRLLQFGEVTFTLISARRVGSIG